MHEYIHTKIHIPALHFEGAQHKTSSGCPESLASAGLFPEEKYILYA